MNLSSGDVETPSPSNTQPPTFPTQPETKKPTYAGEIGGGVGRVLSGIAGLPKQLMTPHDTAGATREQEVKMGPVGRIIYNTPADIESGWMNAEGARQASARSGEGIAGQALTYGENLPIVGGIIRKAEEAGPGYAKAAPQTAGAVAEGATIAGIPKAVEKVVPPVSKTLKRNVREALGPGKNVVRDLVKKTTAENESISDANQKQLEEFEGKRAKEERLRRKESAEYARKKSAIQGKVESAKDKANTEIIKQAKIPAVTAKLKQAWSNLRAGVETAREKALDVGNEKYDTVNEELKDIEADDVIVTGAMGEAESSLRGSTQEPTILKDMQKTYRERPPTYDDLQGDYSRLGRELTKGTLPGDLYQAYDVLHEAIGKEMQRIADGNGQGAQLTKARDYWRRMKQTFGKPLNPSDAASGAVETASKDLASADEQANRIRLLGSFDSRLPGLFKHIENLRTGSDSLPKTRPIREILKPVEEAQAEVTRQPSPSPIENHPPVNPKPLKNIGEEEMSTANKEQLSVESQRIASSHSPFVSAIAAYDIIRSGLEGNWSRVAIDVAARAIYGLGKQGYAKLLEQPGVIKFLTDPTAKQISEIPMEMRGAFKQIAQEAQAQGVKVDPRVLQAIGIGAAVGSTAPKKKVSDFLK
jgi:hypothetical protein